MSYSVPPEKYKTSLIMNTSVRWNHCFPISASVLSLQFIRSLVLVSNRQT